MSLVLVLAAVLPPGTGAQFLPFGRNKISHEEFVWRVLETEHFDIHYDTAMADLARRGAAMAEESFRKLEQVFNHTITERIPLILYASPIHFQQTNVTPGFIPEGVGGFFEFIKGRVVIPANGSTEQFRHVINHELVHVFMHSRILAVLTAHGLSYDRYPPLWYVEGLAEHYSTEWDDQAEMLLRDAVINGYLAPLQSIWSITGSFLMYKEGQSMLGFMAREYGPETIIRLIDNLWMASDFGVVMKATIGRTPAEFDADWMRDLRRRYFPLVAGREKPGDVMREVVARGFSTKPVPVLRGDSTWIVYTGNDDGYTNVAWVPLDGGTPEVLVRGERSNALEEFHLLQGRMAVSADSILAFVTKSGASDVLHLFDLHCRRLLRTITIPGIVMISDPSFSPDGGRIAFAGLRRNGCRDLFVLDRGTGAITALTDDVYDDSDPAWSPDGRCIAFISDRCEGGLQGRTAPHLFTLSSGGITRMAPAARCASPAWNAAGSVLLFTADYDGARNVYARTIDAQARPSGPLRRITNLLTAAFDPVLTRDGDLVCSVFDAYSFQIRRIPGLEARIDSCPAVPEAPPVAAVAWQPAELVGSSGRDGLRYSRHYQLDVAQSEISTDPVFGTSGGAAVSLSDMLGNDRYLFLLYNTAQTSSEFFESFNLAVSRVSLGQRAPHACGLFNTAGRRYDLRDPDEYFFERSYGGYFSLAWPLSKFRRVEGTVSAAWSDKEGIFTDTRRKALLVSNTVSFVHDNALYYITGPIDGSRFNVTLGYTTDVMYSKVDFVSVMVDYRRYFRLDLRTALATRVELLFNHGEEARRWFMGGELGPARLAALVAARNKALACQRGTALPTPRPRRPRSALRLHQSWAHPRRPLRGHRQLLGRCLRFHTRQHRSGPAFQRLRLSCPALRFREAHRRQPVVIPERLVPAVFFRVGFLMRPRMSAPARNAGSRCSIAATLCAVWLLAFLLAACGSGVRLARPLTAGAGDWAQLGGDAGRSGVATSSLAVPLALLWTGSMSEAPLAVSPLVVDGMVLCTGARGTIDALDLRTGAAMGSLKRSGVVKAVPAMVDGVLAVAQAQPGIPTWLADCRGMREAGVVDASWIEAPVLGLPGRIVTASVPGRLACHRIADTAALWTRDLPTRLLAAPSLSPHGVVVAGANGDVWCIDASSGGIRWRVPTGAPVTAAPVCVDDAVCVATGSGLLLCLDAESGRERWRLDAHAPFHAAPACDASTLVAASADGMVVACDSRTGGERWRTALGGLVGLPPVITGEHVALCRTSGELRLLRMADGATVWSTDIAGRIVAGPVVAGGILLVITEDGEVRAWK